MKIDPRKLCQIEIYAANVEQTLNFYARVFGWNKLPVHIHDYHVLDVPKECGFGISIIPAGTLGRSNGVVLYFSVSAEQIADIVAAAKTHGGKVLFGPKSAQGYGEIYQIEDPNGVRWGLFVPKEI
jgi:predicted enzyme related to lactoylglutathione lyase